MAAAGDKLEASGGERLVTLLGGRPIQEPLPVVRSQTPAEHRTSGAPSGELAYFQLTPADTPRSPLVGRRLIRRTVRVAAVVPLS